MSPRRLDDEAGAWGRRRIETALRGAVRRAVGAPCPAKLAQAFEHAVFPGGGRVRPLLTLGVARACGDADPALADAAAASVELIHCASLVHDDMPCFDDAAERRGSPTVHRVYGEEIAVLVGDGLIALAFETLALAGAQRADRLPALIGTLAAATGAPRGIVAGQAWESEATIDVDRYHQAKTAALFEAAAAMGAVAAGADADGWRAVGREVGAAYQAADDLADVFSASPALGKPEGQDARLGRPNVALRLGVDGAVRRLDAHVASARQAIPAGARGRGVAQLIDGLALRLCPADLRASVQPGAAMAGGAP